MFIDTTLNLHADCLARLTDAARRSGRSRTEIITDLLKHVMDIREDQIRCGRRVRYQVRAGVNTWHVVHVKLRPDEYEYFLDLRKLLKMSVSLILSIAVEKYLKILLEKKTADNYQTINYMIVKRIIDGITHWTYIWGFPPTIEPYIHQTDCKAVSALP